MVLEYLVVHYQFDWCACSLLLRRCVHEHFVHILSMKHVVPTRRCLLIFNRPCNNNNLFTHISSKRPKKKKNQNSRISPFLLIISQIIHTNRLTRLPIAIDQFAKINSITFGNIHIPFPQPFHAVCSAGNRCSYFSRIVCSFVDGDVVTCSS